MHSALEIVRLTRRLALVAHLVGGLWLVSWSVDGRVICGLTPYWCGSDEEN